MLAMIGVGAWLGAAIDTYGRFLKREKRAKWVVFVHDVLFWLLQGLIAFYVLLLVNEGALRFYILIALVCGFAAYQSILRYVYLNLLETIIHVTVQVYQFLAKVVRMLVIKPIQILVQAGIIVIIGLWKFILSTLRFTLLLAWRIIKLCTLPLRWIAVLGWRLLPKVLQKYLYKIFKNLEGFFTTIKNRKYSIVDRVKKFWKKR